MQKNITYKGHNIKLLFKFNGNKEIKQNHNASPIQESHDMVISHLWICYVNEVFLEQKAGNEYDLKMGFPDDYLINKAKSYIDSGKFDTKNDYVEILKHRGYN